MQVVNDLNLNWINIKNVNFQFIHPSIYVNGVPPMFNEPHVLSSFPSCLSFFTIWGFCSFGKWLLTFFFSWVEFPFHLSSNNQPTIIETKFEILQVFQFYMTPTSIGMCPLKSIVSIQFAWTIPNIVFSFQFVNFLWGRCFGNHP